MRKLFLVALALLFVPLFIQTQTAGARSFQNQNNEAGSTEGRRHRRRHRRRHLRHTVASKTKTVAGKTEDVGETTVDKSKTVGNAVVDKSKTTARRGTHIGRKVVHSTKKAVTP